MSRVKQGQDVPFRNIGKVTLSSSHKYMLLFPVVSLHFPLRHFATEIQPFHTQVLVTSLEIGVLKME
jgi:hypothetical protein